MFLVEMLPAGRGDCLLIEYGDPAAPLRMLIDGGMASTAELLRSRIEALPPHDRRIQLLVVTHIDLDHIAGVLELLENPPVGLSFGDVWFNGWKHLPEDPQLLSVHQGEALTDLLERGGIPWNRAFGGGAVAVPSDDPLPEIVLPGGMVITLLSPSPHRLSRLRAVWKATVDAEREREKAGHPDERNDDGALLGVRDLDQLAARPFEGDRSVPNGSSIAFVASYGGKRCLFAADAYAGDLRAAVEGLARREGESKLLLDAMKLSHHGGRKNTSLDLLASMACRNFLFSTDGSVYGHPHEESVARVIVNGASQGKPRLIFNYRSEENLAWNARDSLRRERYEPVYPDPGRSGAVLEL